MATCKDCAHFDVCDALDRMNGIPKPGPIHCGFFKDKADMVEVVRCKDCKHGQRNNSGQLKGHYICEYDTDGPLNHPRHFCGYGERREQE